jgi:hypothetical protein
MFDCWERKHHFIIVTHFRVQHGRLPDLGALKRDLRGHGQANDREGSAHELVDLYQFAYIYVRAPHPQY